MDTEGIFLGRSQNGPVYFDKWKPEKKNQNYIISGTAGHGMSCLCKSLLVDNENNGGNIPTLILDPNFEYQHEDEKRGDH